MVASCEAETIDSSKYTSSPKAKRRSATLTSSQSVASLSLKTTKVPTLDLSEVESGQLSSNRGHSVVKPKIGKKAVSSKKLSLEGDK